MIKNIIIIIFLAIVYIFRKLYGTLIQLNDIHILRKLYIIKDNKYYYDDIPDLNFNDINNYKKIIIPINEKSLRKLPIDYQKESKNKIYFFIIAGRYNEEKTLFFEH